MHSTPQYSAIAKWMKQVMAIASCTGLLTGLPIVHVALTARPLDADTDRSTLQSNALADASVTRLEIYLNRRQAILYQGNTPIKRYSIGTGRQGWETPVGTFRVMQMKRNPTWISPFTNERIAPIIPKTLCAVTGLGFGRTARVGLAFMEPWTLAV